MVKKSRASRGRPRQFDEDAVVDAAVGAFFNGFEDTTLGDLEEATGLDRSTIYNSFGGKRGLYERASDRYLDTASDSLFGPLEADATDGLDAVVEFLRRLESGLASATVSPGCFIVNDMATVSNPDGALRYRALLESGVRSALLRASSEGAIDADSVERRTALLTTTVIGINLISRHTGDHDQVRHLADATIAEVESWRT